MHLYMCVCESEARGIKNDVMSEVKSFIKSAVRKSCYLEGTSLSQRNRNKNINFALKAKVARQF